MKKRFLLSILTLILSFAYCHGGNPYTTLYIYGGKDGEVYLGKLNANEYKYRRAEYDITDAIFENYEDIREDVGDWYDIIF